MAKPLEPSNILIFQPSKLLTFQPSKLLTFQPNRPTFQPLVIIYHLMIIYMQITRADIDNNYDDLMVMMTVAMMLIEMMIISYRYNMQTTRGGIVK